MWRDALRPDTLREPHKAKRSNPRRRRPRSGAEPRAARPFAGRAWRAGLTAERRVALFFGGQMNPLPLSGSNLACCSLDGVAGFFFHPCPHGQKSVDG